MIGIRALWRRFVPPSDGAICAVPNPTGACDPHARLGTACCCLELRHHRAGCRCGQGAEWVVAS